MNCKNCGAPVDVQTQTGHLQCPYCHSHQWTSPEQNSADGIVASSEKAGMFCPGCMDDHELQYGMLDRMRIAFCPDCFGFQIGSDAFRVVLQARRSGFSGAEDQPVPVDPSQLELKRNCPKCHQRMETHPYYGPGNSVIDSCNRCKSVWLDHGEMNRLVKAPGRR